MTMIKELLKKTENLAPVEDNLSPELIAYLAQPMDQLFIQPDVKGQVFSVLDVMQIAKTVKEMTGADPVSFSEFEVTFERSHIDRMNGYSNSLSFLIELRKVLQSHLSMKVLASNMRPLEEC